MRQGFTLIVHQNLRFLKGNIGKTSLGSEIIKTLQFSKELEKPNAKSMFGY
jgi:hypothetical protein